ncbi:DUF4097 and DUF4098 domain-containing protein YvlB [Fontibacillus phaseoli]|uniref:DUF4097 and DUF4098 domain-containing protein YvlB n=1 Tax=Fontibacillus phaseoli TaxID=1416533 RepID=A0A369BFE4_9BACL|nr:DUF4097 family beta strand repeat-containing protein [Fontibacillus phaseoli]RCX19197.1 DUF4097 and DUF4098 domain-containing protein YvlB [Fontibacillus phaseoli]
MNSKKWSLLAITLIIAGFAGMAYQGFEFGDENPYHQQKWSLESLNSLSVDSSYDVDVEFIESPDGSNYIEVGGNMAQDTIDKLKSASITGPDVSIDLTEKFKLSFLTIDFQSTKQHITVALADQAMIDEISFKLHSNNGHFSGLRAKDIELTTSSGNLSASSIISEELEIKATSGNVTATDIQGETEIAVASGNTKVVNLHGGLTSKGTSGKLTVIGAEGPLDAKLTSGNIVIKDFTGAGVIHNTSGNVSVSDQRSDSLDISVRSGNVTLSVDPEFKGIYDLKAVTGDVKAPDSPMETKDLIKVRTTSGNIKIH